MMRRTVALARQHNVAIGAHPGFPDLAGFGRRAIHATPREVEDFVLYQVSALAGVAAAEGTRMRHVKAHGALYLMACRDRGVADAVARAVAAFDATLILFGLHGSVLLDAGRAAGLQVAAEGFADRAYEPDGHLASRQKSGSVIHDPATVVARAVRMVRDREVVATDGSVIRLGIDTLCLHGDTTGAAELAAAIRRGVEGAGITVAPVARA